MPSNKEKEPPKDRRQMDREAELERQQEVTDAMEEFARNSREVHNIEVIESPADAEA